ncbi:MAG: hypothetical protein AAGA56_17655 [Myxococcota bacterium]
MATAFGGCGDDTSTSTGFGFTTGTSPTTADGGNSGTGPGEGGGDGTGGDGGGDGRMEDCGNGLDDDGDGLADCADPECASSCESSCEAVVAAGDPSSLLRGALTGRPDDLAASCSRQAGSELVYEVTPTQTGFLSVFLRGIDAAEVSVSARTACADNGSEVACSDAELNVGEADQQALDVAVTEGMPVQLVVEGAGEFVISFESRPGQVCGDGFVDGDEECDDALGAGGGCDDACMLLSSEPSANDTAGTATPFPGIPDGETPFYGSIDPVGDVDYIEFTALQGESFIAQLFDLGNGDCSAGNIDSLISLSDGTTPFLDSDDFGGPGACSELVMPNLDAGTYYIVVEANAGAPRPTFGYELNLAPVSM